MTNNSFPILGTKTAPMIGRSSTMERVWRSIDNSHLSLVGPRYSGKSVFLKALAIRMGQEETPYDAVILLDLHNRPPHSDSEFLEILCESLATEIKADYSDYASLLRSVETDGYRELHDVIKALHDEDYRVLMLWDGFDKPLGLGKLTLTLWDQLRVLASLPNLRLMTATRRVLPELIRDGESQTSQFWNIFHPTPVRLGPFDKTDQEAVLSKIENIEFSKGAKTELENWTAGYPPIYLQLVNQIIEEPPSQRVDDKIVKDVAPKTLEALAPGIFKFLWSDCSLKAKDFYRDLIESGPLSDTNVGKSELDQLVEKGFAKSSGNKITLGCRLLKSYVQNLEQDGNSVLRSFSTWEKYSENIRDVLELRFNQIDSIDSELKRFIERTLEDIPDRSVDCLYCMIGIRDRALDLIFDAEIGSEKKIPNEWLEDWERFGEFIDKELPLHIGPKLRLLQLLTGAFPGKRGIVKPKPKAQYVSKSAYFLIQGIHNARNLGQHSEGEQVHAGVAVTAVIACIELASLLERELGNS